MAMMMAASWLCKVHQQGSPQRPLSRVLKSPVRLSSQMARVLMNPHTMSLQTTHRIISPQRRLILVQLR